MSDLRSTDVAQGREYGTAFEDRRYYSVVTTLAECNY